MEGIAPNGVIGFVLGLTVRFALISDDSCQRLWECWAGSLWRFSAAAAGAVYCCYAGLSLASDTSSGGWGFMWGLVWPTVTYWFLRLMGLIRQADF